MKKLLALWCSIALILACACPVYAEEAAPGLSEITLMVKEALNISDDYTTFNSNKYGENWELTWSNDSDEINVTCSDAGLIYSYSTYEYGGGYKYSDDFTPSFPNVSDEDLTKAAEDFLSRVITGGESWTLDGINQGLLNGYATSATLSGLITIGEYPTDIYINVTVDYDDLSVSSYYRGDSYMKYATRDVSGEINVGDIEAREKLSALKTLDLKYYVVNESDMAKLLYVPNYDGTYIVRASDGKVIDMDEAYNNLYSKDAGEGDGLNEAFGASRAALTEAEKKGISVYDDALTADEMDAKARAMTELGISDDYALTTANYINGDILTASLTYSRPLTSEDLQNRYGFEVDYIDQLAKDGCAYYDTKELEMDAHTGELISMYTYRSGAGIQAFDEVDTEKFSKAADDFLAKYLPGPSAEMRLSDKKDTTGRYSAVPTAMYSYTRVYNGYLFDGNYAYVTFNAQDGTVENYSYYWNNGQEFEEVEPSAIIDAEKAHAAYLDSLTFEAAYISLPVAGEYGETNYELTLCWHYKDISSVYGVDAQTGELFTYNTDAADMTYTDISGIPQQEKIEKLARFGVGFGGPEFQPEVLCSYRDMLILFLGMDGYTNLDGWEYAELASSASYLGASDFSGADQNATVTRGVFASELVKMAGYGKAASLSGIYSCGFADDARIDPADYGAVAIAYGMGLIAPDDKGNINADAAITRAEAAEIAFGFLSAAK